MEKDPDLTDAMNYLNRVKEEYKDDITVYDHFLELMRDYKNGKNDAIVIVRAVEQLFKGKKYLIDGFANFLPRCMSDRIDQRKGYERSSVYDRFDRFERPERHDRPLDRMERHNIERPPMDRMMERPTERPIQERAPERYERNERPPERFERYEKGPNERAFNPEMKEKQQVPFYFEDTNKQKRALQFVHKVKRRFVNTPETYKEFIRVLQIYQKNPTNADKILNQLKNLLNGHDDLLRDFVHFIPNNLSFINEILKQKDLLQPFTKLLNMYNQNCITPKDFLFLMKNILNNDRLLNALATFINYKVEGEEVPVKKLKKIGSYRIYPEEMRSVDCLEQSNIARAVLNNYCMSSAFGSEETTFLASKKNAYEEILYKIEDERYECEMNIFRIGDFIVSLEELFDRIMLEKRKSTGAESEDDNYIEFTIQDINMPAGIIQEVLSIVYRDKAIDILEGILTKPQISIPIVLKRLYLVYNRMKVEMNEKAKMWREVTVKNIYKARECSFKREKGVERYVPNCIDDFVSLYNEYSKVVNLEGRDIFERVVEIVKDSSKFCFYASVSMTGILRLILEVCDCLQQLKSYFEGFEEKRLALKEENKEETREVSKEEKMDIEEGSEKKEEVKIEIIPGVKEELQIEDNQKKDAKKEDTQNEDTKRDVFYDASNDNAVEKMDIEDEETEEITIDGNNKEIAKKLNLSPVEEDVRNDLSKKDYNYLLELIKENLKGDSDNQTFEDTVRLITDSKGQRIYNIEKTMLKIDRYCNTLKTEDGSMQLLDFIKKRIGRYAAEVLCDNEKVYIITKKDYIQIEEVGDGDDNLKEVVRFFLENDERDDENVYADYGLEIVIDKNYKIKYVENTNDFVMRRGKKRMLSRSVKDKK